MIAPPSYFERIRLKAEQRWDQLEEDPGLAGPWHLLFKQVQSPRHVLSELLQNADDAGATYASVDIENKKFTFSHNGEDFTESEFASLCRFGYSNKRVLHTIGFRGIGFKSTFSLTDEVFLSTPTISVSFHRDRFTEPNWVYHSRDTAGCTEIYLDFKDENRRLELEKNLQEWLRSPASLLFFRSIRCVRIGKNEIRWTPDGPGPVENSEWMMLSSNPGERYLLLRSSAEPFPREALEEIRQERMIAMDENVPFPPCCLEIVLGLEGRLFVVLPTGVITKLPFACNAPFIQDPARIKVKDPAISSTNRWLLERAGRLAAEGMLTWINRGDFDIPERCEAYALFPGMDKEDSSLEGCCAGVVDEAFKDAIDSKYFLLSEAGSLTKNNNCVGVPARLLDIWTVEQVTGLFVGDERSILSRHVAPSDRQRLRQAEYIEEISKKDTLRIIENKHMPKPGTWLQLLLLWHYVSGHVCKMNYVYRLNSGPRVSNPYIVPVKGKDLLYTPSEVIRLGDKKLLQSKEDWEFFSKYLLIMDQGWTRFMSDQRSAVENSLDDNLVERVEAVYRTLDSIGLGRASAVNLIVKKVATSMSSQGDDRIDHCVRLSQIAATLNAMVSNDFFYYCGNGDKQPVEEDIVADLDRDLDLFISETWYKEYALHEAYWSDFKSCTESEWRQWIISGRSGLQLFFPIIMNEIGINSREKLVKVLHKRGFEDEIEYPYKRDKFIVEDWDFDEECWSYWESQAEDDDSFWGRLFSRILEQPKDYWNKALSAAACQVSTGGTERTIADEEILPLWIMKFRALPCLKDNRGHYRQPAELLRRTPETEGLIEIEPFISPEYDNESTRPLLIKLGVRDTPTGPERFLDRLRALAQVQEPPVYEVERWYHRLDQMFDKCSTDETMQISEAFANDKIILTEDSSWARTSEVFLSANEDDAPGAAIVHPSTRHLSLWRKIGVAERPTVELALAWLRIIPTGHKFHMDELRRVKSLLSRHAARIWNECGHWLNLEGEWGQVQDLEYKLTMQTLTPWAHLFQATKQVTADLRDLQEEECEQYPFATLSALAICIENHLTSTLEDVSTSRPNSWISLIGSYLKRIELGDEREMSLVVKQAERMERTKWIRLPSVEIVPYIDDIPVGTPRSIKALWQDDKLYVENRPLPQLFKQIARELAIPFGRLGITEAIKACFARSEGFVHEYMEENFQMRAQGEANPPGSDLNCEVAEGAEGSLGDGIGRPIDSLPDDEEYEPGPNDNDVAGGYIALPGRRPALVNPRPRKTPLIELFARSKGYVWVKAKKRFYNPKNGNCISKSTGSIFPWEQYSETGELVQCYWEKHHCVQLEPLELDKEVWDLCERSPGKHTLLLIDEDDQPIELSGHELLKLHKSNLLKLYLSKYRLVYEDD